MIVFDNDDDCAIPEDKIDVDHDDPSKMGKSQVQDWTDVEQVMVVPGGAIIRPFGQNQTIRS